jgi:hypothetical protein
VAWGIYGWFTEGSRPSLTSFLLAWKQIGSFADASGGLPMMIAVFAGLWSGAAAHTLTDIAGTFVKTGRIGKTL